MQANCLYDQATTGVVKNDQHFKIHFSCNIRYFLYSESNVAVVHQNAVEVLLLDQEGGVVKQSSFKLNDLFHNQLTEIQVSCYAFGAC